MTADNAPYAVPLNYALSEPAPGKTWAPGSEPFAEFAAAFPSGYGLIFHCASEGRKLDLLASHPRVCFTVVPRAQIRPAELTTHYESVTVFGKIRRLAGKERSEALRLFGERFCVDYPDALTHALQESGPKTIVLRLDMEGVTGKFNPRHQGI